MKKILLTVLLTGLIFSLSAEEGELTGRFTLYDSQNYQPFFINSDGGWIDIGQIYPDDLSGLTPPPPGTMRKWRVRTTYIDESSQGQSTLQVKLRQNNRNSPVFTLPWTERASRWQEKDSNWYIPYSAAGGILEQNAVLSVRLIAPPRTATPGKVYKIELEAWDFLDPGRSTEETPPEIRMAFSSPAALAAPEPVNRRVSESAGRTSLEKAEGFSLDFVENCLEGNLPGFYKSLDDQIRSLDTGLARSRYSVPPPAADLSGYTMRDYKANYRYHMYDYDQYVELFPEWTAPDRRWKPDRNCYLFLGTEVVPGGKDFMKGQNLVFMVRYNEGEWKIIGLPE